MLHAAILWLPYIQLHHDMMQPPPLIVRLEPLPKPITPSADKPLPADPISQQGIGAAAKPAADAMSTMNKTQESADIHQFPKHLRLIFAVYQGSDSFRTGESDHQLDIYGDRYTLQAVKKATGLNSLRNTGQLIQTSRGTIGKPGLQPEVFEEETATRDGNQSRQATLDRKTRKLSFSPGSETTLPEEAQDILSFMYQLSQLPVGMELFQLPVIDGTHLEQYQIEIGVKENITTPMGKLRTLRLRKIHDHGKPYFEIWLGLEYRRLPVKFSQFDGSGKLIEEYLISDIRTSNE